MVDKETKETNEWFIHLGTEKVTVSEQVFKVFRQGIDSMRNTAVREGRCNQTNHHRCSGDCSGCPYAVDTKTISYDVFANENFDFYADEMDLEEMIIQKETVNSIYEFANTVTEYGAEILRMCIVNQIPDAVVGRILGLDRRTVAQRKKKVLLCAKKKFSAEPQNMYI